MALVTGAAQGQGAAEARALHREGAFVYVADVLDGLGREVCATLGSRSEFLALDVSSETAWRAALSRVGDRHARLDVLVNNAAILGRMAPLVQLEAKEFLEVLEVNLLGVFLGMKYAVPLMGEGASIINISSVDGVRAMPGLGHYVASKFGVRGLTRTAAAELGPGGIRVNAVLPGAIDTAMVDPRRLGFDPRPALAKRSWLRRVGEAGEVAELVVFLASDESSFCTGADFAVDGGWLA